jgi:hypothetical protein
MILAVGVDPLCPGETFGALQLIPPAKSSNQCDPLAASNRDGSAAGDVCVGVRFLCPRWHSNRPMTYEAAHASADPEHRSVELPARLFRNKGRS